MSIFGKKQPAVTTEEYERVKGERDHWRLKEQVTALTVAQRAPIAPTYDRQLATWNPQDESLGMIDRVAGRNGAGVTYIGQLVIVQPGGTYVAGNQTHTTTALSAPVSNPSSEVKARVAVMGYTQVTNLALLSLDDPLWHDLELGFNSDRKTIRRAAQELLE
jgi:hypothetical protein